jgi:plasmid stabilization system protein ParE
MLPIKVTRRAAAQIQEAGGWWLANRPAAPEALKEELQRAFDLIAQQPAIGARATNIRLPGIRRIHLSRVHYHLYYRLRSDRIEVVALWHTGRGKGPYL